MEKLHLDIGFLASNRFTMSCSTRAARFGVWNIIHLIVDVFADDVREAAPVAQSAPQRRDGRMRTIAMDALATARRVALHSLFLSDDLLVDHVRSVVAPFMAGTPPLVLCRTLATNLPVGEMRTRRRDAGCESRCL